MSLIGGIDPGAKYTALTIIKDDKIVLSSTYVRPDDVPIFYWADQVCSLLEEELDKWEGITIGVEGVVKPQTHFQGKKSFVKPEYLINVGIMAGSVASRLAKKYKVVIVRPGKNGSNSIYPPELEGRRPASLAGIAAPGVRGHERSSYDIAIQVPLLSKEGYELDYQPPVF